MGAAAAFRIAPAERPLESRVLDLRDELASAWSKTPDQLPTLGPCRGILRRWQNRRAAVRLIDRLAQECESLPADEEERRAWQESVRERLQRFGEERLSWPAGYRRLLFGDSYFRASRAFAKRARAFAPELGTDSLFQAMRNVWIGNSLQMLLDLPVGLGKGLFAYSMLYPLTDNALDSSEIAPAAKRGFVERFGRRLAGLEARPTDALEAKVFTLVDMVEEEYPRGMFPRVHESLLAIHRGQVRSLSQQGEGLPGNEVLLVTCEKGGTSVLADLYLVAGVATPEEERFAFSYGVLLQLLDDLQDVEADLGADHATLFTRAARDGPLDGATSRLGAFLDRTLDEDRRFAGQEFGDRRELIQRNCLSLLVGAVAEHPRRFSRSFRRTVSRQSPVSLSGMRRLKARAEARFKAAGEALRLRSGASLLDWLLVEGDE